jgi:hypothetical protein
MIYRKALLSMARPLLAEEYLAILRETMTNADSKLGGTS